jgi:hypothetical protein
VLEQVHAALQPGKTNSVINREVDITKNLKEFAQNLKDQKSSSTV